MSDNTQLNERGQCKYNYNLNNVLKILILFYFLLVYSQTENVFDVFLNWIRSTDTKNILNARERHYLQTYHDFMDL